MPPTQTDEGLVVSDAIRSHHPEAGVLLLSQYLEPAYALRLLEQHPERVGYLLKERVSDIAVLTDALARIAGGECVVDPTIVARLLGSSRGPLAALTDCERDVLALMAEGHSNRAICGRLFLSPKTVEAHIRHVFLKLGRRRRRSCTGASSPSSRFSAHHSTTDLRELEWSAIQCDRPRWAG